MQSEKPDAAQDPAEGSRETIDRELARESGANHRNDLAPYDSGKKGDEQDVSPNVVPLPTDDAPAGGMRNSGSGAVKGGEAAKPGQMQGDEDVSAKGP
jgi:hypothetical protein